MAFVGQLHYSTTKERIESFFRSQGVEGTPEGATVNGREDEKEVGAWRSSNARRPKRCMRVWRATTHLDGRRVNAEKSAGGGKATKKDKLKRHRERQDAKIEESVDWVIGEFARKVGSKKESLMKA